MVAQIIKKQIEQIEYREKKIFWVLFSLFAFLIISYGILVNNIFSNGVSQQNMEKNIVSLNSDVNTLEFQYLGLKNSITLALAESKGFVSVAIDKFAVVNSVQKNLSLSVNEN